MLDSYMVKSEFLLTFAPSPPPSPRRERGRGKFQICLVGIMGRRFSIFTQHSSVPLIHYSICLDGILSTLTRPDSDHLFNWRHKDLSVPNFSCLGSPFDGLYHLSNQFIGNDEFNLRLR